MHLLVPAVVYCLLLARSVVIQVDAFYIHAGRTWCTSATASLVVRDGDVTGDGKVTVVDALQILQWLMIGWCPPGKLVDADYNYNNRVDIGDVLLCLAEAIKRR
jgi:hypothetical protein